MALKLITAVATEPITTADMKTHLRVDVSTDDTLIASLVKAARESFETFTRRAAAQQTWELILDSFPGDDVIELPFPPLGSVTSVKYTPLNGSETTFSSANYLVDINSEPGRIVLKDGLTWPTDTLKEYGGVVVRFVCGYGITNTTPNIPDSAVAGMKLLVGDWYENREETQWNTLPYRMPTGTTMLWWPWRTDWRF